MFAQAQDVLNELLTTYNHTPERLSDSEKAIASRICSCTACHYMWVRRKAKPSTRCPRCHSSAWDRPYLSQLAAKYKPNQEASNAQ